jgi:2-polyprenyl-6-methoxyphenol hydroxylase-like FAD-dependent oxidoreductase
VHFGERLIDIVQDGSGVRATARQGDTETETTVEASYLVGADGGRQRGGYWILI